jgi:hypothetical protein
LKDPFFFVKKHQIYEIVKNRKLYLIAALSMCTDEEMADFFLLLLDNKTQRLIRALDECFNISRADITMFHRVRVPFPSGSSVQTVSRQPQGYPNGTVKTLTLSTIRATIWYSFS